jgi:hypothetical protein
MTAVDAIRKIIPQVKDYVDKRISEFERLGKEGRTHFDFRPFVDIDYGLPSSQSCASAYSPRTPPRLWV